MNKILAIAKAAAEEKKAHNPLLLDLRAISGVTDYFLVCSGNNPIQVRAIADNILDHFQKEGVPLPFKEGYHEGLWILLDLGEVVIHILRQEEREFYALEHLWHDAKPLVL
ncbi:ribosome-associated protein [Hydrogenispora ethanolica]|jgi:ribosome-associated protein|uniref:Ribosomal silencing factor RsfS n=1 Tax=Hydrogenispora ethanolica TaxID=1082276 RepID=A0A4R1QT83_HYDET|nr:ribosome silencing factor [Hydrogenispora ethanolica]TCL57116.1 ribosome-associated protein [Hydrogenispora ethanolica]